MREEEPLKSPPPVRVKLGPEANGVVEQTLAEVEGASEVQVLGLEAAEFFARYGRLGSMPVLRNRLALTCQRL